MRHLLLPSLLLVLNAQALTPMPDPALRAWAAANYPGCIVGESIDENHSGVQNEFMIDISGLGTVTDLHGLQAFANASQMNVSNNPITLWAGPPNLRVLYAENCGLAGTYLVAPYLWHINVSFNDITTLDLSMAEDLQIVRAPHNQISSVVWPFPGTLMEIDLGHNQLTTLGNDYYAPYAYWIDISYNQFTQLEGFNNPVSYLNLAGNLLTEVWGVTGSNFLTLDLSHNQIEHVADLGATVNVDLSHNPLTLGIDLTSYNMHTLRVNDTQLPCLPYLHNSLVNLYCTNSPINCLPNQPAGLVMDEDRFGFEPMVCNPSSNCYMAPPTLDLKVFLQGPFDPYTNTMRDDLRAQGLIPSTDPYPAMGFTYTGDGWPDEFDPDVLDVAGPEAVVDWVVVDLYPSAAYYPPNDAQRYSRPALLRRDGQVVALDGSWPLALNTPRGHYQTAVRHRNHLGAIDYLGMPFDGTPATIDFTSYMATRCYPNAMHGDSLMADERQLWSGDVNFDHMLRYTGTNNDRDLILQAIGGENPAQALQGVYHRADVNMDGKVKYTGEDNDRDPILLNIGGSDPTVIRYQVGFQ